MYVFFSGNLKGGSVCTFFVSQHLNNTAVVEVRLDSTSIVQLLVNGDVLAFDESLSYHFKGNRFCANFFFFIKNV